MAGRWRELFGSDEKRFRSRLAFGQSHAESSSANVARVNAPGGQYFNGLLTPPEYGRGKQAVSTQRRECTPMATRSLALARLRGHREAFLDPGLPQWRLAGDGSGRLIAVKVEAQRNHARAATVKGAKGGDARPRLVEPQQGVVRTLADVLRHAAERPAPAPA